MKRKNFFILLELPFDPPTNDVAQIKSAIHSKSQEWSRMQSAPQLKSSALENIELIPAMEEVMLDDTKRAEEAKEAGVIRGGMAASFEAELRVLETKGYLLPRELKELHQKYRAYGFDYELVRALVHVPVTDTPIKAVSQATDTRAYDYDKAMVIKNHLDVLGKNDLYDFLNRTPSVSAKDLFNVASAINHHTFHSQEKTGQTSATLMLTDLAFEVFENETNKASYDLFLGVNKYPELSALINDEYKRSGYISPDVLMRLVNFGITTYGVNVLELEEYIRRYAKAYGMDINIASPQIICPVCEHHSPRGTTFCAECSSPLEGNCPSCNTFFTDGAKVCSGCGFPVGKMGLALPFAEKAKISLSENDWVEAGENLRLVEQYWPNFEELEPLRKKMSAIQDSLSKTISAIDEAIKDHKFYTAQKLVEDAEKKSVIVPSKSLSTIETTIANFESQLLILTEREHIGYDNLTLLASQVADSLELNQLLAKYPPEAPSRITVGLSGRTADLAWSKVSASGLISYVLVRKKDSMPLTAFDGEILYEGEKNHFEDSTLTPLEQYFYSVFSKRGSNYSSVGAVTVSAVRLIPPIENFLATPADGAALLSWDPPAGIHNVKIWRKSGNKKPTAFGDGAVLANSRIDSFTDTSLSNNKVYWYYAVAEYETNTGETFTSQGVICAVTPHDSVIPIDQFLIIPTNENHRYFINWEGPSGKDVLFFSSVTNPNYPFGKMMAIDELLEKHNRLELDSQIPNNGRFDLDFIGSVYIFPVVVSGKFGAVGKLEYLTNVPEIENPSHSIIGNHLYLNFVFPEGEGTSAVIAWREDIYPNDPAQTGTRSIVCSREEYALNDGVKIPELSRNSYYFKIFNQFVSADGKAILSEGVNLFVDNTPAKEFFYDIVYKKSAFSSFANISVTIMSEHIFSLPRAVLVGKVGGVPLHMNDGNTLFEMDRQQDLAGSLTFKYKSEVLPSNLYIRLFFIDSSHYQKLRPLPTQSLLIIK